MESSSRAFNAGCGIRYRCAFNVPFSIKTNSVRCVELIAQNITEPLPYAVISSKHFCIVFPWSLKHSHASALQRDSNFIRKQYFAADYEVRSAVLQE